MKIILETDRLLLREFVPDDLEDFHRLVSDPDVTRYTGDGEHRIEEVRKGLEERVFRAYRQHGYGRWATVLKASAWVIGFAGLKYLDDVGETDVGYRFFKEYWGRGLATEASAAVVRYGFEQLRLEKVVGIAHVENKASIRVLEKVGFTFQSLTMYLGCPVVWYVMERAGPLPPRACES
ncbi:MAG TPA: GNAT family N-acetyltransferase [Gemmataceae bacterium]|jgi:RimJ/RimL family protein N-acetyltransferase|nr:GNAT family N-acetyltransferase [Gemmataceae bacterium]